MRWNRWVIPPAVTAGVFATAAVAPPVAERPRGLVVDVVGDATTGRPVLLAVSLDDRLAETLFSPGSVRWTVSDSAGHAVGTATFNPVPGTQATLGRLFLPGKGPWTCVAHAGDETARFTLVPGGVSPGARVPSESPTTTDPAALEVEIEGGALIPEIPGTLLVRAPGASGVTVDPESEALTVEPRVARTEGCGIAAFQVRVQGMDAPVHLVGAQTSLETRLRLPIDAGGLAVTLTERSIALRSAVIAGGVFIAAGDTLGPTWWAAAELHPDAEGAGVAIELPPDVDWAVAARSVRFGDAHGGWRSPPSPVDPCVATPLARRWFARIARLPVVGPLRRVFDGAARAAARGTLLRARVRRLALTLLALSIAFEVALVLGAGLARDPMTLGPVQQTVRARLGLLLAGVGLLMVAGFGLAVAALLHAPGE